MQAAELENLRYPVGKYSKPKDYPRKLKEEWTKTIAEFPNRIIMLTQELTQDQLNWRYRPDGWTIKQVVHHVADSHSNGLRRYKLALTEDRPKIKPYLEAQWAELVDSISDNLEDSLLILRGTHRKWVAIINAMSEADFKREFVHPEFNKSFSLNEYLGLYAWHCNHHRSHIEQALEFKGKFN